jgi:hypothetical protein
LLALTSLLLLGALSPGVTRAADETSSPGRIAIPAPAKPTDATSCVEPVDVMRRDHMDFLMHQRDATVLSGQRERKYSLVGCMDCHNPASDDGQVVRYEDPEHFCSSCHSYASVRIDCFECHADRGLLRSQQGRLGIEADSRLLSAHTFSLKLEQSRVD